MSKGKSFIDRLADQATAKKRMLERAQTLAARVVEERTKPQGEPQERKAPERIEAPAPERVAARAWAQVRLGTAMRDYSERASGGAVAPQPWARDLVNLLLQTAERGGVTLCLMWPGVVRSLSLVHALANMERWFAKDLRGLRTLFFPGTYTTRAALQSILASRNQAADLYLSLLEGTTLVPATSSPAMEAALVALTNIRNTNPDLPNPSLAELIPVLVFDPVEKQWVTAAANPLERTLSKVGKLAVGRGSAGASAFRNELRQKVGAEWRTPERAPSALMVLHHSAKKDGWVAALSGDALKGAGKPEALLLDATQAATNANYVAVRGIPTFIKCARENGLADVGSVIVTDDPKTFFGIRSRLADLKVDHTTRVWAAEGEQMLLSNNPVPEGWKPTQRSNSNFSVHIVDQEASQVALLFQRLLAGIPESGSAYEALMSAYSYVLRLSNMPAGYTDLTAAAAEAGTPDFGARLNAWTPVVLALRKAVDTGPLSGVRDKVDRAIARAEELIDAWKDATPIASRLLAQIRKHAGARREEMAVVLPSKRYVLLAHRFLKRKLGDEWQQLESRIHWHILSSVTKTLSENREKHFVFVGLNRDVIRILLAHEDVPHGTEVMVSYRHALATLQTLAGLKTLDALKAYRGRIGLLEQELDRRMKEIPNGVDIGRLKAVSLTFRFEDDQARRPGGDHPYYTYHLEGGGRTYATGWIYRYAPDEDPPFRRTPASSIQQGEFVFDMSDELRAKLETSLQISTEGFSSIVDPVRMLLKLYHDDVKTRCAMLFQGTNRSALAREIYAKMLDIDARAKECRLERVYYWLDLEGENDSRPHAAKDANSFRIFCRALQINDETAAQYWAFVRETRRVNQYLGRELVARYAEILFQPESAAAYRKVPPETITALQQDALQCVYRVESIQAPEEQSDDKGG